LIYLYLWIRTEIGRENRQAWAKGFVSPSTTTVMMLQSAD
jgi:hypothetical protein